MDRRGVGEWNSTVEAPIVAVRGEAVREVAPDIAKFSVTVAARDRDRQATLARLTLRVVSVGALLDEYGRAVERRETGGIHVSPERRRAGERVAVYQGSVTTTVTVSDFSALGEIMLRLADQDQTTVYGPWWELRPDSQVSREVRRAALSDAVNRAREYADVLGARLVRLLEISDVGMATRPLAKSLGFAADAGGYRAPGGTPELELEPQPQTVHAQVEARFTITEPIGLTEPAG
jgi:uncharacterized protein YggE